MCGASCRDFSVPAVTSSGSEAADIVPLHPCDPVEQSAKAHYQGKIMLYISGLIATILNYYMSTVHF